MGILESIIAATQKIPACSQVMSSSLSVFKSVLIGLLLSCLALLLVSHDNTAGNAFRSTVTRAGITLRTKLASATLSQLPSNIDQKRLIKSKATMARTPVYFLSHGGAQLLRKRLQAFADTLQAQTSWRTQSIPHTQNCKRLAARSPNKSSQKPLSSFPPMFVRFQAHSRLTCYG